MIQRRSSAEAEIYRGVSVTRMRASGLEGWEGRAVDGRAGGRTAGARAGSGKPSPVSGHSRQTSKQRGNCRH